MGKQLLKQMYENLKPLNFEKKLMFQKYCEYLVENEQINQCCVDNYTTEEFLYGGHKIAYENYKMEIDEYNEMMDGEIRDYKEEEKYLEKLRERELTDMREEFEEEIKEDERKIEIIKHFLRNLPRNIIVTYCIYKLTKMFI